MEDKESIWVFRPVGLAPARLGGGAGGQYDMIYAILYRRDEGEYSMTTAGKPGERSEPRPSLARLRAAGGGGV